MAHVSYDVLFNAQAVKNVRSTGYNDSAQVIIDRQSGSADPGAFYLGNSEPMVSLQSTDLLPIVNLNGATFVSAGLCLEESTTTVPLARRAECSVLSTGTSHLTMTGNRAIIIPTQFEVRQDSEEGATCNMEVRFRSTDGITAPVAVNTTQAIAATSLGQTYGLGKAFFDDVSFGYLTGIIVNPGIQVVLQRYGGGIFPQQHYIQFREPTIDIMVENVEVAKDFINAYYLNAYATCRVFFRARKAASVFFADTVAAHIRFSFASAFARLEALDAAQSGNGSATVRVHGKALVAASAVVIA